MHTKITFSAAVAKLGVFCRAYVGVVCMGRGLEEVWRVCGLQLDILDQNGVPSNGLLDRHTLRLTIPEFAAVG